MKQDHSTGRKRLQVRNLQGWKDECTFRLLRVPPRRRQRLHLPVAPGSIARHRSALVGREISAAGGWWRIAMEPPRLHFLQGEPQPSPSNGRLYTSAGGIWGRHRRPPPCPPLRSRIVDRNGLSEEFRGGRATNNSPLPRKRTAVRGLSCAAAHDCAGGYQIRRLSATPEPAEGSAFRPTNYCRRASVGPKWFPKPSQLDAAHAVNSGSTCRLAQWAAHEPWRLLAWHGICTIAAQHVKGQGSTRRLPMNFGRH